MRRSGSRLAGALELFSRIDVQLAHGRNLDVITQAVRPPGPRIAADIERTAYAGLVAELSDRVCEERHPAADVFELAAGALADLAGEDDPRRASAWFCARALEVLGYTPQLRLCASCQRPLEPAPAPFVAAAGGLLCADCEQLEMTAVSLQGIKVLRVMVDGDRELFLRLRLDGGILAEVEGVLESQLEYHLDRQLKSLRFLRQLRSPVEH